MLSDGGHRLSVLRQFICGIITKKSRTARSGSSGGLLICRWFSDVLNISRQAVDLTDVYKLPNIMYTVTLVWWPNWSADRGSSAGIVKPLQLDAVVAVVAATCAMLMLPGHCCTAYTMTHAAAVSRERWSCHQHHRWVSHDAEDAKIPQMYVWVGASLGRWEKGKPWLLSHRG